MSVLRSSIATIMMVIVIKTYRRGSDLAKAQAIGDDRRHGDDGLVEAVEGVEREAESTVGKP